MSWPRRRGRPQPTLLQTSLSDVREAVHHKLAIRLRVLHPIPIPPEQIYHEEFTKAEHAAIATLKGKGMLKRRNIMQIAWDKGQFQTPVIPAAAGVSFVGGVQQPLTLVLAFRVARPMGASEALTPGRVNPYRFSKLPPTTQAALVRWGYEWVKASQENAVVETKIRQLFEICTTVGQVYRVWPNLLSFLPDAALRKIRNAKVKSPLPEEFRIYHPDTGKPAKLLAKGWNNFELEWFDSILSEALMITPPEDFDISFDPATVVYNRVDA